MANYWHTQAIVAAVAIFAIISLLRVCVCVGGEGVKIVCDGLEQKFQHARYFTCDPLIFQPIFIRFPNDIHCYSQNLISFHMINHVGWCDNYFY